MWREKGGETRRALTVGDVCAVVVRLDHTLGVVGVDVEGVEMGADALYGRKVLVETIRFILE